MGLFPGMMILIYMRIDDFEKFKLSFPNWAAGQGLYLTYYDNQEHKYNNIFGKVCDSRTVLMQPMLKEKTNARCFCGYFHP